MSDFKPITTRLREVMRNSLASGESADTSKWELCVDAPIELFNNECNIIDSAYVTLEGLYATSCDACDKLDERCTQLKRERDAIAAELDRVQGEAPDLDGWMKLPLDRDGVPVHVGDEVTEHEGGHTFKVDGIKWWMDGWWVFQDQGIQAPVERCTHYHAPTVEDVLREFAEKMNENLGMYTSDVIDIDEWHDYDESIIAEYADKLREVMHDGRD